jgi:hypothetical protein
VIALPLVAVQAAEALPDAVVLDAFGDHGETQLVAERDDGLGDGLVLVILQDVGDEDPVGEIPSRRARGLTFTATGNTNPRSRQRVACSIARRSTHLVRGAITSARGP